MTNHYHLLMEQSADNGISKFVGNVQNSYTKYFNVRHQRKGPLFLSAFRCKLINTEAQFLHLSRYIHLNPFTAYIIKDIEKLKDYPYSSCPDYFGQLPPRRITYTSMLNRAFRNPVVHWDFVANQADYQKQLAHISHLLDTKEISRGD
jgi:putative transposase